MSSTYKQVPPAEDDERYYTALPMTVGLPNFHMFGDTDNLPFTVRGENRLTTIYPKDGYIVMGGIGYAEIGPNEIAVYYVFQNKQHERMPLEVMEVRIDSKGTYCMGVMMDESDVEGHLSVFHRMMKYHFKQEAFIGSSNIITTTYRIGSRYKIQVKELLSWMYVGIHKDGFLWNEIDSTHKPEVMAWLAHKLDKIEEEIEEAERGEADEAWHIQNMEPRY